MTITNRDIIHRPIFHLRTRRFGNNPVSETSWLMDNVQNCDSYIILVRWPPLYWTQLRLRIINLFCAPLSSSGTEKYLQ
jgi:hypothetical protein